MWPFIVAYTLLLVYHAASTPHTVALTTVAIYANLLGVNPYWTLSLLSWIYFVPLPPLEPPEPQDYSATSPLFYPLSPPPCVIKSSKESVR